MPHSVILHRVRYRISILSALVLIFLVAGEVAAGPALNLRGGLIWIGNAYREEYTGRYIEGSDVSPLLTFAGAAFDVPLGSTFRLSPGIDIWYKDYVFTEGRAVPTQIETGPAVGQVAGTFGIVVSIPIEARFALGGGLSIHGGIGPAVLLRAPIFPVEGSDTDQLVDYFYSNGRFFHPELRAGGDYEVSERIGIRFELRGFAPFGRIVTGNDGLPWWDQLMISGQVGMRLSF